MIQNIPLLHGYKEYRSFLKILDDINMLALPCFGRDH